MSRAFLAALLLATLAAAPAHAGPPWVSIELPANPLNTSTRDAFLLVRVYHHGDAAGYPVTGTATRMVNGERQVMQLRFDQTNQAGLMALHRSWDEEGTWVLAINVAGSEGPTALVGVVDGEVRSVDVPTRRRGGATWGRPVTEADVDATLRELAGEVVIHTEEGSDRAALLLVLPLALGLVLGARRLARVRAS